MVKRMVCDSETWQHGFCSSNATLNSFKSVLNHGAFQLLSDDMSFFYSISLNCHFVLCALALRCSFIVSYNWVFEHNKSVKCGSGKVAPAWAARKRSPSAFFVSLSLCSFFGFRVGLLG